MNGCETRGARIRVLVVHDHDLFRTDLASLLCAQEDIEVLAQGHARAVCTNRARTITAAASAGEVIAISTAAQRWNAVGNRMHERQGDDGGRRHGDEHHRRYARVR